MESVTRFFQAPSTHFFLFGARGTGKSTWLRANLGTSLWIDLLDPAQVRHYEAYPERLRDLVAGSNGTTLVIDEVQKVPDLLPVVHQLIEDPATDVRFVLTGSSARKLRRTGVDLLAGRALLRRMHPFMAAELGSRFDLQQALRFGLLPLVWARPERLQSYAGLYLQEEVKAEGLVRSLGSFARFLEAISLSQASVLNLAEVARECEVNRKTAEGYLEVLEDLLLSFRLPVFTRRARRQLVGHPKFFLFDAGAYQAVRPRGPLDSGAEIGGAALETLVAQHLRAWNDHSGGQHGIHYWRTKSGTEVDFVVYGPDGLWALEVKHSRSVQPKDLRGLATFREDYPEAQAALLYQGERRLVMQGIPVLPVTDFLLELRPGEPVLR